MKTTTAIVVLTKNGNSIGHFSLLVVQQSDITSKASYSFQQACKKLKYQLWAELTFNVNLYYKCYKTISNYYIFQGKARAFPLSKVQGFVGVAKPLSIAL